MGCQGLKGEACLEHLKGHQRGRPAGEEGARGEGGAAPRSGPSPSCGTLSATMRTSSAFTLPSWGPIGMF